MNIACTSNAKSVLRTLKEGGVNGDEGKLQSFAAELYRRCTTTSGIGQESGEGRKRASHGEMMEKAKNYSLMSMEEDVSNYLPSAKSSAGRGTKNNNNKSKSVVEKDDGNHTIVTKSSSSRGSSHHKDKKVKKSSSKRSSESKHKDDDDYRRKDRTREEERTKRRRRRRYSSSSDESGASDNAENGAVVVDEEELWRRREERREELQRQRRRRRKGYSSDDEKNGQSDDRKLTAEEREEMERERDIRERDEFAKRLVEKDRRRQRSKLDDDGSDYSDNDDGRRRSSQKDEGKKRMERLQKGEERDKRLARGEEVFLDDDDDDDDSHDNNNSSKKKKKKSISIHDMREESRRAYLQKRTKRELELLERELADEEELIAKVGGGGEASLTLEEKRELQLKRDILRMAREHGHVDGDADEAAKKPDGFYRLPDEFDGDDNNKGKSRAQRGEELLTSRYVEPKMEKSEQELWEEGQTQMAAGLTRRKKKVMKGGDEDDDEDKYDFVFEEEQIDFVCVDTSKGYDNRSKKKDNHDGKMDDEEDDDEKEKTVEIPMTKHEKILEGRKKLPVFPYREEFLMALKEHQVLVLVGETGR